MKTLDMVLSMIPGKAPGEVKALREAWKRMDSISPDMLMELCQSPYGDQESLTFQRHCFILLLLMTKRHSREALAALYRITGTEGLREPVAKYIQHLKGVFSWDSQ